MANKVQKNTIENFEMVFFDCHLKKSFQLFSVIKELHSNSSNLQNSRLHNFLHMTLRLISFNKFEDIFFLLVTIRKTKLT